MVRIGFVAIAAWLFATTVVAQQWAEKMFSEKSHDFGAVPRAAKVEYEFTLTNVYKEDVHIAGVRSSCGCTQPRILKDTLKTHETGAIIAAFNTSAFSGKHGARVTVTIDRPNYAEVELDVRGYIRTDVVLNPGQVTLGSVPPGETADKKIRIDYAGRNDWKITGVTTNSPYLTASIKEAKRSPGRVSYELDVQLKEGAPAGYLNDELLVATNDHRAKQFPVKVEGLIVSELTVSPAVLTLGTLQPGQKITKQIVVKGAKPFKIVSMHCLDSAFTFDITTEAKIVHLVPVTFVAGSESGKISQEIEIVTDLGENATATLSAVGQVAAPLAGN
jgi:hypothetical protein